MNGHGAIKLMLLGSLGVGFFVRGDLFVGREAGEPPPAPAAQASPDPPRLPVAVRAPSRPFDPPGPARPPLPDEPPEAETVDAGPSSAREEAPAQAAGERIDFEDEAHAFATAVLRLSAEADAIDRVWRAYGSGCQVSVGRSYDFGREWFALWDQAIESRATSAECAEMLQWLVDHGETLRRDLASALSQARRARLPAETVEGMLRWHSLEWRP